MADDADSLVYSAITEGDLSFVVYDFLDTGIATSGSYHTAGEWTSSPTFEAYVSGTAGSPTNTLLFPDPSETIYDILDAGGGFTVLPFYEDYWGGTWDTVTYNGVSGRTELTGSFGLELVSLGETVHLGDIVVANLLQPVPLHISVLDINNPGDDTLEVEGDITAFVTDGDRFRIHQQSPYKYDFSDELKQGPCDWGARYTWSGYRRMPWHWSRAGEDPYHTWNRWYLPSIGRWTSPDPAASPWENFSEYASCQPLTSRDPSGLLSFEANEADCTVTMKFDLGLYFIDGDTKEWTQQERDDWAKDAETALEADWSGKYKLVGNAFWWEEVWAPKWNDWTCTKKVTHTCPCPSGWEIKLDITVSVYTTLELAVTWNILGEDGIAGVHREELQSAVKKTPIPGLPAAARLDYDDVKHHNLGVKSQQRTISHEFGHMIGLQHPNKEASLRIGNAPNHAEEYNDPVTGKPSEKLMGYGGELSDDYFAKWKDYLDGEGGYCGPFNIRKK